MSPKPSTKATSLAPNTHKLLPLTISAVNIGLALGGTLTVNPLLHPSITPDAVATWFNGFFTPGLITILTIGFSTLAAAVWTLLHTTKGTRLWLALGLMFTIAHFGFGPFVSPSLVLSLPCTADARADPRRSRADGATSQYCKGRDCALVDAA